MAPTPSTRTIWSCTTHPLGSARDLGARNQYPPIAQKARITKQGEPPYGRVSPRERNCLASGLAASYIIGGYTPL